MREGRGSNSHFGACRRAWGGTIGAPKRLGSPRRVVFAFGGAAPGWSRSVTDQNLPRCSSPIELPLTKTTRAFRARPFGGGRARTVLALGVTKENALSRSSLLTRFGAASAHASTTVPMKRRARTKSHAHCASRARRLATSSDPRNALSVSAARPKFRMVCTKTCEAPLCSPIASSASASRPP